MEKYVCVLIAMLDLCESGIGDSFFSSTDIELRLRLDAVKSFLAAGGAMRCDLRRFNGRGLSWKLFGKNFRGRAVVLKGLRASEFAKTEFGQAPWSRSAFLSRYGHQRIKTNNGHFDHIRSKEITTIRQYIESNASTSNIFLADHAYGLYSEVTSVFGSPDPGLLGGFEARPILSLGVKASSTRFHQHAETWQYLLAGRKVWWLTADPKTVLPGEGGDPCASLLTATTRSPGQDGIMLCVQHPGELIYFGNQTSHATCNLEKFTLGFGAQGHMEYWPKLHRAARLNDTIQVRRLVEEVGDVDMLDSENCTALHRAVSGRHLAVAELLVGAGASLRRRDRDGKHALIAAAERGDMGLVEFLVDAGAPIRRADSGGAQALHWSALSGHIETVKYLLAGRASLHAQDKRGTQPVHWAALESDPLMLGFIISHGGDIHAKSKDGIRPIHWAAGVGHASMVHQLIVARVDPDVGDNRGITALHLASAQDRLAVIKCLVAGRSDVAVIGNGHNGMRPLHVAAGMGHRGAIELLLYARAPVEAADSAGKRAVHSAAEAGHSRALAALRKHGHANLVVPDMRGQHAAHFAAGSGHVDALQELLANRAQLIAKDKQGTTPLELARSNGHQSAVALLKSVERGIHAQHLPQGRSAMEL